MRLTKYTLGALLALGLTVAACQPAGTGTDMPGTVIPSTSETEDLMTDAPLASPTGGMTEMATEVMTGTETVEATVTEPMMTATAEMTTTAVMTGTQTPVSGEALYIRGGDLLGIEVADTSGTTLGTVDEVLADEDGQVVYLLLNYNAMALTERRLLPLAWSEFSFDQADEMIAYSGTTTDLDTLEAVNQEDFDAPGFIWDNAITGTETIEGGLIRLGRFTDFDLRNNEDEDLGEVDDLVFDLQTGKVAYALVNFGGFLGLGEKTIVVPWSQFTVEQTDDDQDVLRLNVTKEDLEAAPGVDNVDEILPLWPEQITNNWTDGLTDFWESITP